MVFTASCGRIFFLKTLLVLLICNLQAQDIHSENETQIRVMSYNIRAGNGDIDEIVRVIREHDPDIVALQEVDAHWSERSDFKDQPRYIGETLDMHYFMGEIYSFEAEDTDSPSRRFGLAILSKLPVTQQINHQLTRLSTQSSEPEIKKLPGFPEIVIEIEGEKLHIYNTHLDYRLDPVMRRTEVKEMITVLESVEAPVILTGDLNAQADAKELRPLFEVLNDGWHQNQTGTPGYTFPADEPDRRIDYILNSRHFQVKKIFVVNTQASDHRPVVADLVLTPR